MNRNIKAALIAILILATLIPAPPKKWMVYADGASSIEEVYIEWDTDQYLGELQSQDTAYSLESNVAAMYSPDYFNMTLIDVDFVSITALRAYVQWRDTNDAFSDDWQVSVWNRTTDIDGGALVTYEVWDLQRADGTPWVWATVTRILSAPWTLSPGDYFFGIGTESMGGSVRIGIEQTGVTGGTIVSNGNQPPAMDPFNEWADYDDEHAAIAIQYDAWKTELTEENTYIGNATHFVARRDLNYSFPAFADNELIRMTVPIAEGITNITRYNGGAWDTILAEADYEMNDYNGTHAMLSILEATINSYGGLYRVYTSTFPYYYTIGGAFYENGTSYGAVNITGVYEGGSTIYEINGTTNIGVNDEIQIFQWDVGDAVRFYYTRLNQEAFNIYFPEDDYATYEFEIRDLTGDLQAHQGGGESSLESLRYVNGSLNVIERIHIADVVNDVPLTLVTYQIYTLRILHPDEHIITFGLFVSGVISNPVLMITEIEFSSQAQITYRYVTVEVSRPTPTQITVNYNDSLSDTNSLSFYLDFRNGTNVYNETVVEDNYQFNFMGVDRYTDYEMTVIIDHGVFGTLTHRELIGVARDFNPFPDLGFIGTFGPLNTGNLMSLFIISVLALAFSAVNAEIGGFTAVSVAYILRYWGVNNWSYGTISICMAIVIGFAMMRRT